MLSDTRPLEPSLLPHCELQQACLWAVESSNPCSANARDFANAGSFILEKPKPRLKTVLKHGVLKVKVWLGTKFNKLVIMARQPSFESSLTAAQFSNKIPSPRFSNRREVCLVIGLGHTPGENKTVIYLISISILTL